MLMPSRRNRFSIAGIAMLALVLALPVAAGAASPLKIREVFPGSASAGAGAELVELQMTADGQDDLVGQELRFYDTGAALTATYVLSAADAAGLTAETQRTFLLATAEAAALGGDAAAPDAILSSADRMDPAGGAVCFTAAAATPPADCVSWGSFPPPPGSFEPPLIPDSQSSNAPAIADGSSLHREISRGCATFLDFPDDSGDSAADFDLGPPSPRNNSTPRTEVRCPPAAGVISGPVDPFENPTRSSDAAFTYASLPNEPGVEFQCHLDSDPGQLPTATPPSEGEWEDCDTQPKTYTGLPDGFHRFWVRAIGENPAPGPAASRGWEIDSAAPQTSITSVPPEPSSGFEAAFGFASSEPLSSFRCQLDDGAIQVCATNAGSGTKSYFDLIDGVHTFRVWATDNAGNKDPTPAERSFTVQTALADFTAPDTQILTMPTNPSPSPNAFFSYGSSEPSSSFECRLDGASFAACPDTGQAYGPLRNGTHSFEVRARDRAGNFDSVAAAYAWRVAAPLPNTRIVRGPPGRVRLPRKRKAKRVLVFRLRVDKRGSSFRCRLDKRRFRRCGKVKRIVARPGRHRFEAYAVDSLGNVETTPARRVFRVVKRGGRGLFG